MSANLALPLIAQTAHCRNVAVGLTPTLTNKWNDRMPNSRIYFFMWSWYLIAYYGSVIEESSLNLTCMSIPCTLDFYCYDTQIVNWEQNSEWDLTTIREKKVIILILSN